MKASYNDIVKQIKNREFAPIYFLTGEEPLYIDKIANLIEESVMDKADRDFNQSVFYAKDTSIDEVIASAREFPFGVDKRVVIVKEAQEWKKRDALKNYTEKPTDSTVLVICCKYAKLKESEAKSFGKNGVVFDSAKVPDYKLADWVETEAKDHNFKITKESAALLAEHIGNDLSRINHEFEKLAILLPENSDISPDIIEKYIGISKQYNVFELRDAIANHDEAKAFKIVNAFCQNTKNNPLLVTVASLFNFYNAMLKYHLAPTKSEEEIRMCFGAKKSPAMLQRESRIAMGFSKQILIKNIAILREFDTKSKGVNNSASEADLYKELIYKLFH